MIRTHLEYLTIWHRYSNQTLRCASDRRVSLCSLHYTAESRKQNVSIRVMHLTSESSSAVSCTLRSQHYRTFWSNISSNLKPNSKILKPVYQRPEWVRTWEKLEVENLVAHSLQGYTSKRRLGTKHLSTKQLMTKPKQQNTSLHNTYNVKICKDMSNAAIQ